MSNTNETQELATLEPSAVIQSLETENGSNSVSDKPWLFKPGVSANPGGRPKIDYSAKIARLCIEKNADAIEKGLSKLLRKGDVKAFKIIAERAYGKLPQPVEHGGTDGGPIEIVIAAAPAWTKLK